MNKTVKLIISALILISLLTPLLSTFALENEKKQHLDNPHGLGGNWDFGETIISSGDGDCFALSDSRTVNFVFEADVEFVRKTGAASLVFLSSEDPSHGSYVANIDLSGGNARIFRFEKTGNATTKGEYRLTDSEISQSTFNLRIEVSGNCMIYFLNNKPIITITDSSERTGTRLGLLTFNASVNYSNVGYTNIGESFPSLTSLTGLSAEFNGQTVINEVLPFGTETLTLTATAVNSTMSVSSSNGTLSVNGNTITIRNISNDLDLVISVESGDIARHYIVKITVQPDPSSLYNEQWRPQFHFSPLKNWMNDPNGLVYDPSDRSWHLFYQYNPDGLSHSNHVWGHAVSNDLVNWKEFGVAISQDSLGEVFSGSCVVDEDNTTGFFTDNKEGESKLVALYTSDGGDTTHGWEKQCIAYSKDHGVTWIKPELNIDKNIVISNKNEQYGRNFRDPKIFRYDGKWFMVVAGGRARLFVSDDLIDWTMACDMGIDSECPDFYPLAVDGDQNNIKWVYNASGRWYCIGSLEKISNTEYRYVIESDKIVYNGGGEVYATQSFYNDGSNLNRRIGISWLIDESADSLSVKNWNGVMSLPYEQTIRTVNDKMILTSNPVTEVDSLRGTQIIDLINPSVGEANTALNNNLAKAYDIEITFKPDKNSATTFTLRSNGKNNIRVIYNNRNNKLGISREGASSVSGNLHKDPMTMPLYPDSNGYVTIRILMDTTVIEVFGNNGEAACTGIIFPDEDCVNSSLSVSGNIEIESLKMWRMTSIWHHGKEILINDNDNTANTTFPSDSANDTTVPDTTHDSSAVDAGTNDDSFSILPIAITATAVAIIAAVTATILVKKRKK